MRKISHVNSNDFLDWGIVIQKVKKRKGGCEKTLFYLTLDIFNHFFRTLTSKNIFAAVFHSDKKTVG